MKLASRFLLVGLLPYAMAWAQGNAELSGVVRDTSGSVILKAAVKISNQKTGWSRAVETNDRGVYNFPALQPGIYDLDASAPGFKKLTRSDIILHVAEHASLDLVLEVGRVDESVTVTASAELLQAATGTLRGVVDQQRIVNLPLNGRSITQLVSIQAGVVPRDSSSGEGDGYAVNGSRQNGVYYTLDGGMNTDSYRNYSGVFPNPDAVEEFSIQRSNFSAEYGNGTGAVVSVITKSGTNALHGSVFEFLRNGDLNARNFFAAKRDQLKRSQFGGTVGGPIRKDKLFFFAGYQGTRLRSDPQTNTRYLLTSAMRSGDFSSVTKTITDPLTKQAFPGNQIPVSRLSSVSQAFLKYIPVPTTANGEVRAGYQDRSGQDEYTARADYHLTAHRFTGRYFRRNYNRPFSGNTEDLTSMYSADIGKSTQPYTQFTVGDVWVVSPNLIANTTFAMRERKTHNDWTAVKLPIDFAQAGVKGIAVKDPASVYISISGGFTARPGWNYKKFDRDYHISESLTWMRGAHELKFGGEYMHLSNAIQNDFRTMGNFTFNGSISGNAFADFMLGDVYQFWQGGGEFKDLKGNRFGVFVQDNWRAGRNLTLNLGLRWDPSFPFTDTLGRTQCFVPGVQSTRFPNAPLGYLNAGDPSCPEGGSETYLRTFSPRFGFAYRPGGGKLAVRGGFGLFWNPQFTVLYNGFVNSAPFSPQVTLYGVRFENPYATVSNPFPASFAPFDPPATSTFVIPLGQFGAFDQGFQPSYMENINLTVEREIPGNLLARVSYVGNMGRRLSFNYDLNYARYAAGATTGNIQARRPYSNFAAILIASSGSTSTYHGLQFSVERRVNSSFSIEANYTWSKSIDEYSDDTTPGQSGSISIPYSRRAGRAVSDFDNTHRLVASWVWSLPRLKDQARLVRGILGGWETAGITTIRSGFPFSVKSGTDRALSGISSDYADVVGDPNLSGDRSKAERIARYFNTSAFALATLGTFGNAPRNLMRGPGAVNFDLSLVKSIPVREQVNFQLRGEFFNAFNNVNLSNPGASVNSTTSYGRITSAGSPRIVQVALKLTF